ncbi:MAG TPA: hypothetical protein VGW32_07845 [Pyrinomonadaceae bacterium]|nr:hypothetical protein [Pyrinomonadaceae bacterium]
MDGETLVKLPLGSGHTIVAFLLQRFAVSLNGALSSGHRQRENQQEEHYAGDKVREWFSHDELLLKSCYSELMASRKGVINTGSAESE